MFTEIDTNGKVLRQGTQGIRVVALDGMPIVDIDEVSDDEVNNLFLTIHNGTLMPSKSDSVDFEILAMSRLVTLEL